MSDQNEGIQVAFGANITGLTDGLRNATAGVQNAVAQMQGHFGGLGATMGALKGPFLALTGLLAGGAMFKDAVNATIQWNGEAMKLARTLGITTQQASILNLALGDIYTDVETYIAASRKLSMGVANGGDAFKKLGIDVKDGTEHLKQPGPLMQEVLTKINGLGTAADKNAAGAAIFGRQWGEASKLLKLNAEVMEEARQKAERLHLVVGPEGVAMTKAYKAAMNDVDDVMTSLKVQIGSAVMPALTKLGMWFGEIGPGLARGLGGAIKGIVTVFYTLKFVIEVVVAWVVDFFEKSINGFKGVGAVIAKLVKGDFQGAVKTAKEAMDEHDRIQKESVDITRDLWTKLGEDLEAVWDGPKGKGKAEAPEGDGFDPDKGKDKGDSRLGAWDADLKQLQQAKAREAAVNGQFYERDLQEEAEYWKKKLKLRDLSDKERDTLRAKVAAVEMESYKQDLEAKKAALDTEISNEKINLQRKLELAKQEQAMHAAGTKGYEQARQKVLAVEREVQAELNALTRQAATFRRDVELKGLDAEEEDLAQRRQMGRVSIEEDLAAQIELEDRRAAIKAQAIAQELAQGDLTTEKIRELMNQRYLIELDHDQKIRTLKNQAAAEEASYMAEFFRPLTSAFQTSLEGLLAGTMTWSNALKNVWRSLGQVMDQMIVRMVMSWVTGEKTKTVATQAGVLQRLATETMGALKSVALAIWTGLKWIAVKGYEAAAGAWSAISSIPYVGPFLAPAVAAGVLASVIGLGSKVASAAGGWETVPHDQMAMIHKDEQILPASYATGLRQLIKSGGAGQGGTQEIHQHTWNVQTMDASSFEEFLMTKGQTAVVNVTREAVRNGRMG